tara:strand:+ start:227 stop:400 length:174 start_codon:yes stop_codon:yes gene_type:complete
MKNEMKQNELTNKDLKTLFTMCQSWIRENEKIEWRKDSVNSIKKVQKKVFNQFKDTI